MSLRQRYSKERGQVLAETAVAMLAFAMFLFGVMQFGFLLYSYDTICNAAREGARYAMVHGSKSSSPATTTSVQSVVQGQAIGLGTVTVSTTWTPNNHPGSVVQVQVTYAAPLTVPLVSTTVSLSATSQMVISY
jgi:Flp pilus assembly protein TadG